MTVVVEAIGLRKVFRTRDKAPGLRASLSALVAPRPYITCSTSSASRHW